jgi:hypothetical protein
MSDTDSLRSFTAKWQALWPEQMVLQVLLPASQKLQAAAWAALFCELQECVFSIEQEAVRGPKSLWWADELQRMSHGQARHPLTMPLQQHAAPFAAIAEPMLALATRVPLRSGSSALLMKQLQPYTGAVAACESALFGGAAETDAAVIGVHLLMMRLPGGLQAFDRAMVPMHLLARHQALNAATEALREDWLSELLALLPEGNAGNPYREAQRRFVRRRLRAMRAGNPTSLTPAYAWDAWRAVRQFR